MGKLSILALLMALIASLPAAAQTINEMPVAPGVPIGCLLSPDCGGNLLASPDGTKFTIMSPVDQSKGLPCLVNPACFSALKLHGQTAIFAQETTIDQVANKGAKVGDYTPLPTTPPLSIPTPPSSPPSNIVLNCTQTVVSVEEASANARTAQSDVEAKHKALRNLELSYRAAVETCSKLPH
jgi:hypothetical protein